MKIQWLGHSCFILTAQDGTRVLIDPFDAHVGYPVPAVAADIVTISHQHADHNYTKEVQGTFKVIDQPGAYHENGITIEGIPTFHDDQQGKLRGPNIVFRYTIDGMHIVHCGDLGHPLTSDQVNVIAPVDVLLLPVGGYYTIDSNIAAQVMHALAPMITIPMHFKTTTTEGFPIAGVDGFLQTVSSPRLAHAQEITITPANLSDQAGVVVLDFPK